MEGGGRRMREEKGLERDGGTEGKRKGHQYQYEKEQAETVRVLR